jgi:hypothetical protein
MGFRFGNAELKYYFFNSKIWCTIVLSNNSFVKFTEIFETQPDWQEQALKDLKAENLPQELFTVSSEGFVIEPIYHHRPTQSVGYPRLNPCVALSGIDCSHPDANSIALEVLNRGVGGLVFEAGQAEEVDPKIFESIEFEYIESVFLGNGLRTLPTSRAWHSVIALDASLSRNEAISFALKDLYENLQSQMAAKSQNKILFWAQVGDSFFIEMAALRALRILANGLKAELGFEAELAIMASTSIHGKTKEEILISNPIQALTSVLGGADMLWVKPHEDSEFGRRIALNISHLLLDEAYLSKNADPTAGSYFIEAITHAICERAWERFVNF